MLCLDPVKKWKLECKASFDLFGSIHSMQVVHFPGASRDSLLLSFPDAKVGYGTFLKQFLPYL